jgi:hypothetical protein
MRAPDALADWEVGQRLPARDDYPSNGEYAAAFHYYRACRRDASPTEAESGAMLDAMAWKLGIPNWQALSSRVSTTGGAQ